MASATGGSGDGAGDRRSSCDKGKTIVGPQDKPKKISTLEKAMLRYLQKCHEDAVAAGQEPPFGGRYAPPPIPGVLGSLISTTIAGGTNKPHDEVASAKASSSLPKDA